MVTNVSYSKIPLIRRPIIRKSWWCGTWGE